MAHEMMSHDSAVYAGRPAWHGLGTVVENAPTPAEALRLAGLGWDVEQHALNATDPGTGERYRVAGHLVNVRSDLPATDPDRQLAVVGEGYAPVQNRELADLAVAIAGESGGDVRVETAGSIRNGRRVYFLLRSDPYTVGGPDDAVHPYILLANGHDGTMAMRVVPTSVRVVCSNTLHAVVGRRGDAGGGWAMRHSGDVAGKVSEIRRSLERFGKASEDLRERSGTLAAADVTRDSVREFWLDVYQRQEGAIPANPTTKSEHRKREKALDAVAAMGRRFDRERDTSGSNAWTALNAYTGWAQHDRYVKAADDRSRKARRVERALLGESAAMSAEAMGSALKAFA